MPIWNPRMETMPRVDLEQLQLERLQVTVNRVWEHVPFYRRQLEAMNITPEQIRSLDDIRLLPFTVKEDLRRGYPYDLFAVPLREVVRLHKSSGTTGQPTVAGYTKNDLRHWRELVARVLSAGGVTKDDVIQISVNYGLLTNAFGLHQGAEEIGASVIPMSAGAVDEQIAIMQDFRTTALVGTPSYAIQIAEVLRDRNAPLSSLHLKWAILGGEPWPEALRTRLESALGVSATDNYGISEVMGPGVSGECEEHKSGLHINEDFFFCEVVDPHSGESLSAGETGELVITTLTKEALPVIRYRTRDLTALIYEQCACGRTFARMARIQNRTDDIFIVGGTNLSPARIEAILLDVEGVEPHYQAFIDRRSGNDILEILVEVSDSIFTGGVRQLGMMQALLRERLEARLGIPTEIRLVEPRSIDRSRARAQRITDRRMSEGNASSL